MKKLIYLVLGFSLPIGAAAQVQNLDFEVCDTSTVQQLDGYNCFHLQGWKRTNGSPYNLVDSYSINNGGITESQHGDMALRISAFYTHDKDMAYQRAAFTSFPASLNGYYKYFENLVYNSNTQSAETDTASVTVLLSKWNAAASQRDTIGFGQLKLTEALNYTAFSCPISYGSNVTPDSILILLNCSRIWDEYGISGNLFGDNSIFILDNLSLENQPLGLKETPTNKKWNVFPNPGNGTIHIADFTGEAALFDIHGKQLVVHTYPESVIDTGSLAPGAYFLRLSEVSGRVTFINYTKE